MPSEKRARQRAMRQIKMTGQQRRARRRKSVRRGLLLLVAVAAVAGIVVAITLTSSPSKPSAAHHKAGTSTTTSSAATTTTLATPTTAPVSHAAVAPTCPPAGPAGAAKRVIAFTKAPPMCISPTGVYDANVVTDVGSFVIRMDAAASPAAVNSFVFLARYHFFDGIVFHRVIPGFVVQGGDPTGTGTGGPGYSFTGNLPPASCQAKHDCYPTWSVALADTGTPSSDGSQFFVVLPGGSTQLSRDYTRFGTVVSGRPVVARIGADGSAGGTPKVLHYMKRVTIRQVGG